MHPGSDAGVGVVRGMIETRAVELSTPSLGAVVSRVDEPSRRALVGSWFGDLGGMILATVVLVLAGLAIVVLWHSGVSLGRGTGESSARESTPPSSIQSTGPDADAEDDVVTDEESDRPRSDTEAIVEILEANDGRMRQAAIVENTDWSKSKVSMLLSDMEEEGDISKLRVGRENIVSLRGNEPEAAGSPFEEE